MRKYRVIILLVLLSGSLFGQLKPSIGIDTEPESQDEICDIPLYLGSFEESGLQVGDTIPHFALYDINDKKYDIEEILMDGKPVVLIGGNYTCPVFRNHIDEINALEVEFGNEVNILIIYGVEAHPEIDTSPYFGRVNVTNANVNDDILYRQPTTYGERLDVVKDLLNDYSFEVPIVLDGPCNLWWETFGPAPTNAYLIDNNGIVNAKHGWFNRAPNDMSCDIHKLLRNEDCDSLNFGGQFIFNLIGSDMVRGTSGEVLYVYGDLSNPTPFDVEIDMRRLTENVPLEWGTSMCVDVCYPADQSEAIIVLEAGETKLFTMYFYTAGIPSVGQVRMGFRNTEDNSNRYSIELFASTELISSVQEVNELISIYPNPISVGQNLVLESELDLTSIQMLNSTGKKMGFQDDNNNSMVIPHWLSTGVYYLKLKDSDGVNYIQSVVVNSK